MRSPFELFVYLCIAALAIAMAVQEISKALGTPAPLLDAFFGATLQNASNSIRSTRSAVMTLPGQQNDFARLSEEKEGHAIREVATA